MYYLTKAGAKFLNEAKQKIKLSDLIYLPLPKARPVGKNPDNLQQGNTNKSQNNPGHEERMKAHQARIDAIERVNRKMGRDVNEGKESLEDFRKFLLDLGHRRRAEKAAKAKRKIPQNLKGKALADALRQQGIENLGFRGPMGRG